MKNGMIMYHLPLVVFTLMSSTLVLAEEPEVWKCKIKESMGVAYRDDQLRPTNYVEPDYEYRILNRAAFINAVGREKARAWWIESEDNAFPLDIGDYFYRNTGVAGDDRWHWSAMSMFIDGVYRNGDNWFNTRNGRFEVESNGAGGWITGEDADYTYHFWECVQFYD